MVLGDKTAFPLHHLSLIDSPSESRICDIDFFFAEDGSSRSNFEGLDWLPWGGGGGYLSHEDVTCRIPEWLTCIKFLW